MFNPTTIQTNFSGLIGFRQHHNASYDRLDSDIVSSASGLYVDPSAHPLLTIENISAIAENFNKTDVVSWSAAVTYGKGEIVRHSGKVYQSLQADNLNKTPGAAPTYWVETNLLSAYLRRVLNNASITMFNTVFSQKKLYEAAKTLLSDTSLYDGVGNLARKIAKMSRFVGYRISPTFSDTVVTISWAGFQFDTVNGNFPLYVYHSSQHEPVAVVTVNLSKAISFEWKQLTAAIQMAYNSNATDTKGYWYIGYYEDDLEGQAIWKEQGFTGSGCSGCNHLNNYLYRQWSKYFSVESIYVENAWLDGDRNLFDEEKAIDLNNQNWGLNFKIQVSCDVTDVVSRNRMVFAAPLLKQITKDLLSDMAFSVRDNQRKEKVSQLAHYALENKENHTKGVLKELEDAIKNVSFDLSSINKVCLPCESGGIGVSVGSLF